MPTKSTESTESTEYEYTYRVWDGVEWCENNSTNDGKNFMIFKLCRRRRQQASTTTTTISDEEWYHTATYQFVDNEWTSIIFRNPVKWLGNFVGSKTVYTKKDVWEFLVSKLSVCGGEGVPRKPKVSVMNRG